jgi:hypothetical protein
VSGAIAALSAGTEVLDIAVAGISAEDMAAALYREYSI